MKMRRGYGYFVTLGAGTDKKSRILETGLDASENDGIQAGFFR
jgi:hypothetical protein